MKHEDYLKEQNEKAFTQGQAKIDQMNRELDRGEADKARAIKEAEKAEKEALARLKEAARQSSFPKQSKNHQRILMNFAHRKDLAKIFSDFTDSQAIDYQRTITARYHSINYSARKSGKNSQQAIKTSLDHSSRLTKRDTLEWLDSLSLHNLYFAKGKYYSHDQFIQHRDDILSFYDEKQAEVDNKADKEHKAALAKASKNRNSYFNKIKKILPSDSQLQPKLLKAFEHWESKQHKLTDLSHGKNKAITEKVREFIKDELVKAGLSEKHISTKLRVLDNYLKHRANHIKLKKSVSERQIINKNTALISEHVFKVPHKNGCFDHIPSEDILKAGISFFENNFPDNKILLGCLHNDESLSEDIHTGINFHIFLDGKTKSKKYNWREQYICFAKNYARQHPDIFPELVNISPKERLSPEIMVLCGQTLQLAVLQHLQINLFNQHHIALRFLSESERKDFNVLNAMLEQDLPLSDRQQSRYNMLCDKAQELTQQNQQLLTENNDYQAQVDALQQQLKQQETRLSQLQNTKDEHLYNILRAIDLWKVKQTPRSAELTCDYLSLLDSEPELKKALYGDIEAFEQRNVLSEEKRLTTLLRQKPKPN